MGGTHCTMRFIFPVCFDTLYTMKWLALIISLFLSLVFTKASFAVCVAPIGPAFDTCPNTNRVPCSIRNDATGVPDLTCCATQKDCDERQPIGETHDFTGTGTQPTTSTSNQGNIFCPKNGKQGISTALGCIVVEGTDFVTTLLNFGIGIAGGIAMLLIIFGGFQILTSAGNPERLNGGKELISSAITGLLMIIFSVFLLRVIGVDILGIPSLIKL